MEPYHHQGAIHAQHPCRCPLIQTSPWSTGVDFSWQRSTYCANGNASHQEPTWLVGCVHKIVTPPAVAPASRSLRDLRHFIPGDAWSKWCLYWRGVGSRASDVMWHWKVLVWDPQPAILLQSANLSLGTRCFCCWSLAKSCRPLSVDGWEAWPMPGINPSKGQPLAGSQQLHLLLHGQA